MKSQAITIRLPNELLEQLRKEADERGMTVSNVITFALWDYVRSANLQE